MRYFTATLILLVAFYCCGPAVHADSDADAGHAVFKKYCISCHGVLGHGDGPISATLDPKPANLADPSLLSKLTDDQVIAFIRNGVPNSGMMPWKAKLSDPQIHGVVAYIRTLSH